MKCWREYAQEGLEYEDWPPLVQEQYDADMELNRQEKYYRENGGEDA